MSENISSTASIAKGAVVVGDVTVGGLYQHPF